MGRLTGPKKPLSRLPPSPQHPKQPKQTRPAPLYGAASVNASHTTPPRANSLLRVVLKRPARAIRAETRSWQQHHALAADRPSASGREKISDLPAKVIRQRARQHSSHRSSCARRSSVEKRSHSPARPEKNAGAAHVARALAQAAYEGRIPFARSRIVHPPYCPTDQFHPLCVTAHCTERAMLRQRGSRAAFAQAVTSG